MSKLEIQNASTAVPAAETLLRRYAVRACLLETNSPLAKFLEHRPGWRVVSRDQVSVLIEHDGRIAAGP